MFKPESLSIADAEGTTDIMAGDLVVMSVTDQDAAVAGKSRQELANDYAQRIRAALTALRHAHSLKSLILGGVYAVISTAVLILLLRLLGFLFRKLYRKLDSWRGTLIPSLRIQKFELLPADRIADFAIGVAKLLRFGLVLVVLYFYASLVLGFFPWTRGYAQVLVGYVLSPLKLVGDAVVAYLPNLFFIAVIVVISIYVAKFVRIIFTEIGKQNDHIPKFLSGVGGAHVQNCSLPDLDPDGDRSFSLPAGLQLAGFSGDLHFSWRAFLARINIRSGECCGGSDSDLYARVHSRRPRQDCRYHGRCHRKDSPGYQDSHD